MGRKLGLSGEGVTVKIMSYSALTKNNYETR